MAPKLAKGLKLVVELDSEGYESTFYRNKVGDFLNGVQKAGLGKLANLPKGVKAFIVDESSAVPDLVKKVVTGSGGPHRKVTEGDIARARELELMDDIPNTEGLPPFEPFPFEEEMLDES